MHFRVSMHVLCRLCQSPLNCLFLSAMIQVTCADSRFPLQAVVIPMGKDLLLSITGGTRPHLGGISLVDGSPGQFSEQVLVLPGHREDEPALAVGRQVAQATGKVVAVAVGIHWDNLTRREIEEIRRNWQRLAEMIIDRLAVDVENQTGRLNES